MEGAAPLEVLPPLMEPSAPNEWKSSKYSIVAWTALAALVAATFVWTAQNGKRTAAASGPQEVWTGNFGEPVSSEFRMLAGYHGQPYTDRQGHKWQPDAYFNGGRSAPIGSLKVMEGLPDPDLPLATREGAFRYDIPVRPGVYELHLYFAETNPDRRNTSEGDELKIFPRERKRGDKAGPVRRHVGGRRRLPAASAGLQGHRSGEGREAASGIRAAKRAADPERDRDPFERARTHPSDSHRDAPKPGYGNADGHVWAADEYVIGGHLVERTTSVLDVSQENLFEGERFGHFAYHCRWRREISGHSALRGNLLRERRTKQAATPKRRTIIQRVCKRRRDSSEFRYRGDGGRT